MTAPRVALLEQAAQITGVDRRLTYGEPVQCMEWAAEIYNAMTGSFMTGADVARVMQAVKRARLRFDPEHKDSIVDLAAYVAIEFECVQAEAAYATATG